MAAVRKPLVALTTFTVSTRDGDVIIRKGQVVAANDPVVKGREALFEPYDPTKPGQD